MKLETFSVSKPNLQLLLATLFPAATAIHCSIHQHEGYGTTSSALISAWILSRWVTVAIVPQTYLYASETEREIRAKLADLLPKYRTSTQMLVQVSMVNGVDEHHEVPNRMLHNMVDM